MGLFLLVSKSRVFFWIGSDFYTCYLDETTFDKQENLISQDLMNKVISHYDSCSDEDTTRTCTTVERLTFCIEGHESDEFLNEYIKGKEIFTQPKRS